MSKIIELKFDDCYGCPNGTTDNPDNYVFCRLETKDNYSPNTVPPWCPLPDSKPYKWADEYEWINAHLTMYRGDNASDCMLSAFNAARELKEG